MSPGIIKEEVVQELDLPDWLFTLSTYSSDNYGNNPREAEGGDKAAISTIIGVYSYFNGVWYMKRYTQVLASSIQALLIKCGRYSPEYQDYFKKIWLSWRQARLLLGTPEDHALADCLFSRIETTLKVIAEREHLTKNTSDVYNARLNLQVAEPPKAEEDVYGL